MARHNREGRGFDQLDHEYVISYQPDWLRHVKVTRNLPGGRQSTLTLFRNPSRRQVSAPGDRVRTRITSPSQSLDFEVTVAAGPASVQRVRVACAVPCPASEGGEEEIVFTLVNGLLPRVGG